jgi:hypothetical protein
MSNYTIAVAWSGKDALSDSNPAKVISGSDFNTEFTAVQTAVNTKADLNGSATESFSATTATEDTNTTQVATTAFVETATSKANIADVVYPVGAIFTTVTAYADSAAVVTAIGGTTWVAFGAGKVLVGLDASDTDFDTAGSSTGSAGSGGAKTHTLTTSEIPAHTHDIKMRREGVAGTGQTVLYDTNNELTAIPTQSAGGGGAHNNVQPYITVYFWKRTV